MDFERLIVRGRELIQNLESRNFRHVSFILHRNLIVSEGINQIKTHPLAKQKGYRFEDRHSELDAWVRIPDTYKSRKLVLVNIRFSKTGSHINMAKPCCKCEPWVRAIFKTVWYSTKNGKFEELV